MTLLTPHSDQIVSTNPKILPKSVMIKEERDDVEENKNQNNDDEEGEEEYEKALRDGYPIDLEFHQAVHQRNETYRAFFRR
ncbi:unnamed protein product [Onchocerca ochengi]|uniref:Uncharacterized protein n=1 Tax=Onchocerca ochengi TaxID=42157 RepID=A0A182EVN8_ONCOC|nr:unnamed protein product [Onchocerca ochengi]